MPHATITIHDSKRPHVASSSNTQHLLRKSTRGPDKYKQSSYMGPWVSETQHTLMSHHPAGPHQLACTHSAHAHPHATSHAIHGSTPQPQPLTALSMQTHTCIEPSEKPRVSLCTLSPATRIQSTMDTCPENRKEIT